MAYKVKPGVKNPARLVGEYSHAECGRSYLDGSLPENRSPGAVHVPEAPEAPEKPVKAASSPENGNGSLDSAFEKLLRKLVKEETSGLEETLRELAEEIGKSSGNGAAQYKGLEITIQPLGEVKKIDGAVHVSFEKVLKLVSCNKPVLLVGPSGCGKSHLAKQVADTLGLDFAFVSFTAGLSEAAFFGRLLPIGEDGRFKYVESDFVRIYENGGLFLLDELDAADANTLLSLNAALANGHCSIPNRPEKTIAVRHPNFRIIATANTFGTGADFAFVGRNQLDDASIDRFRIGMVPIDYDVKLEEALCPDSELREDLWELRSKIRQAKLRRTVSTRFLKDAHEMKALAGWGLPEIHEALFSGWTKDERAKVAV